MHSSVHASESLLVAKHFANKPGYFVEVGANEPEVRSQTWMLEQAGWTGILIEPQPSLAESLRRKRTAKVVEAACSSPDREGHLLTLHLAGPLSSLDRSSMAPGAVATGSIEVQVRTLDSVLTECGAKPSFDFLSIDVEGHELDVLSGFSLAYWQPRLILLEDHVADLAKHRFMVRSGYKLIRRFESNGWYVPHQLSIAPTFIEAWEIARKYYLGLPFRKARNVVRQFRSNLKATSAANAPSSPAKCT